MMDPERIRQENLKKVLHTVRLDLLRTQAIENFNTCHSPEDGKFCETGGAGGGGGISKSMATRMSDLPESQQIAINKYLKDNNISYNEMVNRAVSGLETTEFSQEAGWYDKVGIVCDVCATETGVDPDKFKQTVAVLSSNNRWETKGDVLPNLEIATSVATFVTSNPEVTISSEEVNQWLEEGRLWPGGFDKESLNDYKDWTGKLNDLPPEVAALKLMKSDMISGEAKAGKTTGWGNVAKAISIYQAETPEAALEKVSGPKISSFFNSIEGLPDEPTIDRHMLRFLVGDNEISTKLREGPKVTLKADPAGEWIKGIGSYPVFADAIRDATSAYNAKTGSNMSPADAQAILWYEQLSRY